MKRLLIASILAFGSLVGPAWAGAYPERPVKIIVPFSPGGGVDATARQLAQQLEQKWGVSVTVENKAGGSQNIAGAYVANSNAGGYTLLMGDGSLRTTNPIIFAEMGFNPDKDLKPVSLMLTSPYIYVINPGFFDIKDIEEYVSSASSQPDKTTWGASPLGTPDHIMSLRLAKVTGVPISYIPYKGTGDAIVDLLGGRIQMSSMSVKSARPYLDSNQLKAIAYTGAARSTIYPDVPLVSESYPDFGAVAHTIVMWVGADTSDDVVDLIAAEVKETMDDPRFQKFVVDNGYIYNGLAPAETREWLTGEAEIMNSIPELEALKQ